jgi:Peptidase family M1 domain
MSRFPHVFAALALSAVSALAADPAGVAADHELLQKWQYSSPIQISTPVVLKRDVGTWTLQSGSVRVAEPTSSGAITGLVFEGQGRFQMAIPDRYEAGQLRRFSGKEMRELDQPFTQLILRTSATDIAKAFPGAAGPYVKHDLAAKRLEHSLVETFTDVDAMVAAALVNPDALYFRAEMNTKEFDWMVFEFDSTIDEEITVTRWLRAYPESWISLDRAEDRGADGRPGRRRSPPATVMHLDVKADLTKHGRTGEVGMHSQRALDGRYVIDADIMGVAPSVTAVRLDLPAAARELKITDAAGKDVVFLRDAIGKRSMNVENKYGDDETTLVFDKPLTAGEKRRLHFEYTLETANYAPGRSWYPTVSGTLMDKHTARLELTVGRKNEVRAMGRLEKKTEAEKTETSVWVVERPVKMLTFSTATRFDEVKLTPQNIPPVFAFGPAAQLDNRDKVHNVGADVANSMQFFQNMFDDKLDVPQFYVTSIAGWHGQAFDGFLHMGEFTFTSDHPGASELFRAHEVAHEWWGHKVGWRSYRDQWLSETMAEYTAMMFVQMFVKGGEKHLEEILDSYEGVVHGNLSGGFSKFARPGLVEFNSAWRKRLGPIAHGQRASTSEIPTGYVIQAYYKGPLVIHQLRTLLRYRTGNDELFVKILRDFLKTHSGTAASTADFQKMVEKHVGGNWSAYFDSWIYGADIPSYRWSYTVGPSDDGKQLLTINTKRSEVPEDFMTIIPIRIEYADGTAGVVFMVNTKNEQSLTTKIAAKPKNVVFGPDHSLLAKVKKD